MPVNLAAKLNINNIFHVHSQNYGSVIMIEESNTFTTFDVLYVLATLGVGINFAYLALDRYRHRTGIKKMIEYFRDRISGWEFDDEIMTKIIKQKEELKWTHVHGFLKSKKKARFFNSRYYRIYKEMISRPVDRFVSGLLCFVIAVILVGQAVDGLEFLDQSVLRDAQHLLDLILRQFGLSTFNLRWDTVLFWPAVAAVLWPPVFIILGRGAVKAAEAEIEMCGEILAREHLAKHPPTPPPGIGDPTDE